MVIPSHPIQSTFIHSILFHPTLFYHIPFHPIQFNSTPPHLIPLHPTNSIPFQQALFYSILFSSILLHPFLLLSILSFSIPLHSTRFCSTPPHPIPSYLIPFLLTPFHLILTHSILSYSIFPIPCPLSLEATRSDSCSRASPKLQGAAGAQLHTHRRPLSFVACFLHVLPDLLQPLPLAMLGSHPEAALETRQPRDGHVHAHGVQETHPGALQGDSSHNPGCAEGQMCWTQAALSCRCPRPGRMEPRAA